MQEFHLCRRYHHHTWRIQIQSHLCIWFAVSVYFCHILELILARGFSQDAWEPPHPRRLGMLLSKYPPLNTTKRSMLKNPHKCHATNIFEETSSFESRIWNQNVNQMCRAENCPTSTYDAHIRYGIASTQMKTTNPFSTVVADR